MSGQRIIFLDVDGVLNNHKFLTQQSMVTNTLPQIIDDNKVLLLKRLVEVTDARLVLISSWRVLFDDGMTPLAAQSKGIALALQKHGLFLSGKIIIGCSKKGDGVREWLSTHKEETDSFVIIDDDGTEAWNELNENLVKTSYYIGLTEETIGQAMAVLMPENKVKPEFFGDLDTRLTAVLPSERQLRHQQLEFYGFIHFGMNTMSGREWGDGTEDPCMFAPDKLDAEQWVLAAKAGEMKGLILTCKHHDGFCLWPSSYTAHTVAASPYQDGNGDIVREVAAACRKHSMKFGIYLSPWDRNQETYGQGEAYNEFFRNQLRELLTGYGEIFEVWFDGACGEGNNGKQQHYDWDSYYQVIRELQPDACIAVCGPDIRWCGNESGDTRPSEWSVVAARMSQAETIEGKSQNHDNCDFRFQKICSEDLDLGSRQLLEHEPDLIWYPAEVNTSMRPGWFYHPEEDEQVMTTADLIELYLKSVGGNASLLLNLSPNQQGLLHETDVARLKALGDYIRTDFAVNLLEDADVSVEYAGKVMTITVCWEQMQQFSYVVLSEDIRYSQRIERFSVYRQDRKTELLYQGTTIGHKKIIRLTEAVKADRLLLVIEDSRGLPHLQFTAVLP